MQMAGAHGDLSFAAHLKHAPVRTAEDAKL